MLEVTDELSAVQRYKGTSFFAFVIIGQWRAAYNFKF